MRGDGVRIDRIAGADGGSHPASPDAHRRIIPPAQTAVLTPVAVSVGCDIRDREVAPDEKPRVCKAAVHRRERAGTSLALRSDETLVALEPSGQSPEAQRANDRL